MRPRPCIAKPRDRPALVGVVRRCIPEDHEASPQGDVRQPVLAERRERGVQRVVVEVGGRRVCHANGAGSRLEARIRVLEAVAVEVVGDPVVVVVDGGRRYYRVQRRPSQMRPLGDDHCARVPPGEPGATAVTAVARTIAPGGSCGCRRPYEDRLWRTIVWVPAGRPSRVRGASASRRSASRSFRVTPACIGGRHRQYRHRFGELLVESQVDARTSTGESRLRATKHRMGKGRHERGKARLRFIDSRNRDAILVSRTQVVRVGPAVTAFPQSSRNGDEKDA